MGAGHNTNRQMSKHFHKSFGPIPITADDYWVSPSKPNHSAAALPEKSIRRYTRRSSWERGRLVRIRLEAPYSRYRKQPASFALSADGTSAFPAINYLVLTRVAARRPTFWVKPSAVDYLGRVVVDDFM